MEAYFDYLAQLELLDLIDSLISDSENESDEENDSGNENGSDDENEHVEQTENIFQLVKYNVLDLFDDAHCRKVFRFDKPTILYITGLVEHLFPVIKTNCSFTRVQPIHLVLIALQFYATGRLQTEIGILLRMTEQSVSKAVECVSNALFSIAREHIKFPANLHALKQDFHSIALLPGVVGCIDGTHFRISRPSEYGEAYQNRTGRYSVNAQAICDAQCRLLSFNVTRPGSMRDSVIFKQSNIAQSFASGKYGEGYLLGDSGYLCTPYLLTPFRNPSTRPEETFNSALKSTRCTIERTFGLLKRRFSCLDGQLDLKPGNVGRIAVACGVLHNVAIERRQSLEEGEVGLVQCVLPPRITMPVKGPIKDPVKDSVRIPVKDYLSITPREEALVRKMGYAKRMQIATDL